MSILISKLAFGHTLLHEAVTSTSTVSQLLQGLRLGKQFKSTDGSRD